MRETYNLDTETIKYDDKIVNRNQPKTSAEFNSLHKSIGKYGQMDPILMRRGLCGDGKNRVRICRDLDMQVLATNVPDDTSDKDFIAMCNTNTFTARNDSNTQKAIKAYLMTVDAGYTDAEAIADTGMPTGTKSVGYARTVACSQYNKEHNVLRDLLNGSTVNIDGNRTKSIDTARRLVRKYEEQQVHKVVEDTDNVPAIDYESMLHTETGNDWFWMEYKKLTSGTVSRNDVGLMLVELANYKFVIEPTK